jgi:hypothetical protein
MTPIDSAHAAMQAAPHDDAARLAFYQRLAESELLLILESEATGDMIEPRVLGLSTGPVVVAFDAEERLADFAGGETAYAGLPGRQLVRMLAGQGIALGLNLGVAPSAFLMPPEAVAWLGALLAEAPREVDGRLRELTAPKGLPEVLLTALDRKLARAAGLAHCAYLSGVTYDDGRRGHLLALIDAGEGAQSALATEIGEALTFSGLDAGELDVAFVASTDPVAARLAAVGLRFDLPGPDIGTDHPTMAPGMDPERPPKLR